MKPWIPIALLLLAATTAHADISNARVSAKRLYRRPFVVYFPWGSCRTTVVTRSPQPPALIAGNACGTRVVCVRGSGNRYRCRW
jgi:hypothetical protein